MHLDPRDIPLSRFGSYLCVTSTWEHRRESGEQPGWYVRWLRDASNTYVFRIELIDAQGHSAPPADTDAEVGRLTLRSGSGIACDLTLSDNNTLRLRVRGGGVRLVTVPGAYCSGARLSETLWEVTPAGQQPRFGVRCRRGRIDGRADWRYESKAAACRSVEVDLLPVDGEAEASLHVYPDVCPAEEDARTFDVVVQELAAAFERWYAAFEAPPGDDAATYKLAAYVLWLSTVAPGGLYPCPVVWGSKNWMTRVWAWDHCFTALGLAAAHPALAWDQFRLMITMQGPGGMLCDVLGPHARNWFCTKSPVHGWTLTHLRRLIPELAREQLEEIDEPMRRWTDFWLGHRDLDGSGLPTILHPNEAFDNTTHTATGGPCKPPEHAAYLVLQCEAVAALAADLDRPDDAARYTAAARRVLAAMLDQLWDGRRFVARPVAGGPTPPGECAFQYVPLLLGRRLPEMIRTTLVEGLQREGGVVTAFGVATEALDSPQFDPEAYVRGRVWTPPNWMLVEALHSVDEHALAETIRTRYLATLSRAGMSECFDPLTGKGCEDPAYNWTAASYLYLAGPGVWPAVGQVQESLA